MTQNPATEDPNLEAAANAPEQPQATEGSSEARITALQAERDEFKDKLLRTLAEMENLRRRTEREIADAKAYAVTSFARDLLGSSDNLSRALESVPEAARGADATLKAFHDGVELTERELLKTLERHGVRKVDPQGEKFDPNLHQAMFEAPDVAVPKGLVSKVVQVGYKIGERVLRPALVGVSAGAPKAASEDGGDKPTNH